LIAIKKTNAIKNFNENTKRQQLFVPLIFKTLFQLSKIKSVMNLINQLNII